MEKWLTQVTRDSVALENRIHRRVKRGKLRTEARTCHSRRVKFVLNGNSRLVYWEDHPDVRIAA